MEKPIYGEEFSIGGGYRTAKIEELLNFLIEKKKQGFEDITVEIEKEYFIENVKLIAEEPYD